MAEQKKKLGSDFETLKKSAREIPGVREYVHSYPVIIGMTPKYREDAATSSVSNVTTYHID